jgi:hypothetical protein
MDNKKYKYITIKEYTLDGKTNSFEVETNNKLKIKLGHIKWHCPWRQYCYFPYSCTLYSVGCMDDINSFIKELMEERKNIKRNNL